MFLLCADGGDFVFCGVEEAVVFGHVEDCVFDFVFVAAGVEEGEEAGVFGFGDFVEGELVEVFEEPGAGEGVVFFGTEILRGLLMVVFCFARG